MPYSLKNRNVLVTGGSRGIGALIAERFASEGANVAINYVSSEERAKETESKITSQYNVKTAIIQGDLGIKADCVRMVKTAIEKLGGLDIVVSNAGWTKFSNFADLDALDEDEWDKCWSTNVKGHMHTFREALPTFNANPEGGVFIITASIAGLIPSGSSMAYSVTKAASLHLVKCLAKTQGSKVRINAVCPGLLLTEWGNKFPKETIQNIINQASLKRPADLDDTADLYITLAKNTSMTGQCLAIDGGLAIL